MQRERIILSGSGGQGLLFIGKLLANMFLDRFAHVTFLPSYGAEVRGGTSNCQVVFSSEEIGSPLVEEADALVLMNHPSVERFFPALAAGGIAVINASLAQAPPDTGGATVLALPATDLAVDAGDRRSANIVMLGAYLRLRGWIDQEEAQRQIAPVSAAKGSRFVEVNATALAKGWNRAQAQLQEEG